MFISDDLFENVLARYIRSGADEVRIVSGYVTPAMCVRLLLAAKESQNPINIKLIVGMTGYEGIELNTHRGLLNVQTNPPSDSGTISIQYVTNGVSVHSKLLIWLRHGMPVEAWMGSSNFTQNGFGVGQRGTFHKEIMTTTNVESAMSYYDAIEGISIAVDHPDVENEIVFYVRPVAPATSVATSDPESGTEYPDNMVILPLVALGSSSETARGHVHAKSGLNWGQRPGREPNQAYIPVPAQIAHGDFFPPKGVVFNVKTSDHKHFFMTVAQDNNKALETPQNNSLLGEYFRGVLGVPNGERVTLDDLTRGGARFVAFYRVDDGDEEPSYLMEYSPSHELAGAEMYRV